MPDSSNSPDVTRLVLSPADVDLLELVLGSAPVFAGLRPGVAEPGATDGLGRDAVVELTDAENTPLARVRTETSGKIHHVEPLRPLAPVPGISGDPAVRLTATEAAHRMRDAAVVVLRDVPTAQDLAHAVQWAADQGSSAPLWLVTSARAAAGAPEAARTTVRVLHRMLADGVLPGDLVVLPRVPRSGLEVLDVRDAPLDDADLARRIGAGMVLDLVRPADRADSTVLQRALEAVYPPQAVAELLPEGSAERGAVVLFSGLSGSGKSTVAKAFASRLEDEGRAVVLLDGDESRQMLSAGLGFDRASRDRNIERLGYVGAMASRLGAIAVTAPIAPFAAARAAVRARAEQVGAFLLVHISTPLDVCEQRDRKGLYARARAGEIAEFTGISSPYEEPVDADVTIDTAVTSVVDAVETVHQALLERVS